MTILHWGNTNQIFRFLLSNAFFFSEHNALSFFEAFGVPLSYGAPPSPLVEIFANPGEASLYTIPPLRGLGFSTLIRLRCFQANASSLAGQFVILFDGGIPFSSRPALPHRHSLFESLELVTSVAYSPS